MLDIIRNSSPPFLTLGNKALALLRLHLASEQKRIEVFINSPPEAHKFFNLFLKRIDVPNTKQVSLCTRQALLCSQFVEVHYTKHWNEMPIPVTLALENQEHFLLCFGSFGFLFETRSFSTVLAVLELNFPCFPHPSDEIQGVSFNY